MAICAFALGPGARHLSLVLSRLCTWVFASWSQLWALSVPPECSPPLCMKPYLTRRTPNYALIPFSPPSRVLMCDFLVHGHFFN